MSKKYTQESSLPVTVVEQYKKEIKHQNLIDKLCKYVGKIIILSKHTYASSLPKRHDGAKGRPQQLVFVANSKFSS